MLLADRKATLRRTERNRFPFGVPQPELVARSAAAQENFLKAFPPADGMRAALYASLRSEVRTDTIRARCLAAGASCWYPRIMPDGRLSFFTHREGDAWIRGRYGFLEPIPPDGDPGARSGFDVVVVPGIAFDDRGRRLGKGYGYYDRFLSDLRGEAVLVGLAFSWQMVPEVPVEPWDVPVDVVVTDEGIVRVPGNDGTRVEYR